MKTLRSIKLFLTTLPMMLIAACGGPAPTTVSSPVPDQPAAGDKLQIAELKPGSGPPITAGQKAVVQYTGWLYEAAAPDHKGKEFDSSRNAGQPFTFTIGAGDVIKGWDQGVLGMTVGASRRLTIPPGLAYGDAGAGGVIPPGATLVFDVDLTAIE